MNNFKLNRRSFLKWSSFLSTQGLLSSIPIASFAEAIASPDQHPNEGAFVLIVLGQGLDVTLGLDPWLSLPQGIDSKDLFIEYQPDQIIAPFGVENPNALLLGPSAASLATYASEISTINGIFQSDSNFGHDSNLLYISSGNGSNRAPEAPVALNQHFGNKPLGLVTYSKNPYMGNKKLTTTSANYIQQWVGNADYSNLLLNLTERIKPSNPTDQSWIESQKNLILLQPFIEKIKQRFNNLNTITDTRYIINTFKAVASSIGAGACSTAELGLSPLGGITNIDSHSGHPNSHIHAQRDLWEQVSLLFKVAKAVQYRDTDKSVFDMTTFMVVSDFSRTPALNGANGKDHNPYLNSVLLAGRNVPGGKSVGKSSIVSRSKSGYGESIHTAAPFDYSTQKPVFDLEWAKRNEVDFIYPENVIATLYKLIGVSENFENPIPSNTKILKF